MYENSSISPDSKWPPTPSREFITLAVVQGQLGRARDRCIGHTLQGNIKQVLNHRKEISIDQIFEADKGQKKPRLVLMQGAPGIGKSTLAWELCRKSMKQYSLVVMLRLREQEVQEISNVGQLFHENGSQDKKLLVDEVSKSQGRDILFILDGFDELPKTLQKRGFLLNLIKGYVLPASTVLVTSRPSATAELRTSCRPQKHIEILGFTQESVETYASSIFSSEPEQLEKFKAYISASNNPAINSLMYIPLNAAIIVLIFKDRKSDALLPHTLTELYTQLCLTILNRYLESVSVDKFKDLPADLYKQFLCLSKVAFEGIKSEEVIFHTVPPDFINFGFLDAVSALYGGRSVSYNFLHLTLQEFFAAYHISHLSRNGLEVFKKHGKDERWNVVWRFVAGLTKFEGYNNYITDDDVFIEFRDNHKISLSLFFIQCLFEAQAVDHFSSIFGTPPTIIYVEVSHTVLYCYALGYCIANFHTGVSWNVFIMGEKNLTPFICGLNTNVPSVGTIETLFIQECEDINIGEFPLVLLGVTVLIIVSCRGNYLSELISNMTCLKELDMEYNNFTEDDMFKTLQQLLHSNVTTLNIVDTGFCNFLMHSRQDFYSALKFLICPSSGKLEKLCVGYRIDIKLYGGGNDDYFDSLASLVSGPSSLKSLSLVFPSPSSLSSHIPYLQNNTCLTTLHILIDSRDAEILLAIAKIVDHNKTLQDLVIDEFVSVTKMDSLRTLAGAISRNKTLLSIEVPCRNASGGEVPDDMRTVKDERIHITWYR